MLRFGFVLLITALPLLGMEAMSTRRETTKQVFDSAAEALNACQSWRLREGQFSALIPAAAPVSTQARPVQTDIRSCEADLDHALVLGRRYSVMPGVRYNKTLRSLLHERPQRAQASRAVAELGSVLFGETARQDQALGVCRDGLIG